MDIAFCLPLHLSPRTSSCDAILTTCGSSFFNTSSCLHHFILWCICVCIRRLQRVILFRSYVMKEKMALGLTESMSVTPQSTLITVHRSRIVEVRFCYFKTKQRKVLQRSIATFCSHFYLSFYDLLSLFYFFPPNILYTTKNRIMRPPFMLT